MCRLLQHTQKSNNPSTIRIERLDRLHKMQKCWLMIKLRMGALYPSHSNGNVGLSPSAVLHKAVYSPIISSSHYSILCLINNNKCHKTLGMGVRGFCDAIFLEGGGQDLK